MARRSSWAVAVGAVVALVIGVVGLGMWLTGGGAKEAAEHTGGGRGVAPVPAVETAAAPQVTAAVEVYRAEFAEAPGKEWSRPRVSRTKAGDRPFLGPFNEQPVEFALGELPGHERVRVEFDLFLIGPWDGSSRHWGEKIWDMDVVGGPRLMHTTFCTTGFFTDNNEQAFPDSFPCRPHPAWTGASERQTLGEIRSWGGPERTFDSSGAYRMSLTFPHRDASLALRFKATLRKNKDKDWGIANFSVHVLPAHEPVDEERLAALWAQLGDADAVKAYAAQWALIGIGDPAAVYIAKHLDESCDAGNEQMLRWAGDLTSGDAAVRQVAAAALAHQGKRAAGALEADVNDDTLPDEWRREMRRVLWLVERYPETATELRRHRARHALQVIGSPVALQAMARVEEHKESAESVER